MESAASGLVGYALSQEQADCWRDARQSDREPVVFARARMPVAVDIPRLRRALAAVVDAHEILRTTIRLEPGHAMPMQVVCDTVSLQLTVLDFNELDEGDDRRPHLIEIARAALAACIDPSSGPVFCAALLRSDHAADELLLCLSAYCSDAHSVPLLLEQIAHAYADAGAAAPLQYLEYVAFQDERLADPGTEADREYWRQHLSRVARYPEFPRNPRVHAGGPRGGGATRRVFSLSNADSATLVALARQFSTDPQVLVLACWQALLWRLSGQPRLRVDVDIDGRVHPDLATCPGPLTRSLPCSISFVSEPLLADLVAPLHALLLGARERQHAYDRSQDPAREDDGRVTFAYIEWRATSAAATPLALAPEEVSSTHGAALQLHCARLQTGFTFAIEIDPQRSPTADARHISDAFETFLRGVFAQPTAPLSTQTLVTDPAADRAFIESRRDALPTVTQQFEAQVARRSQAAAIADGVREIAYGELNALANRIARTLRERGVGPDVLVALLAEPSIELIAVILGVLKAGGGYVPLDATAPDARLQYQLIDSGTRFVITNAADRTRLIALASSDAMLGEDDPDSSDSRRAQASVQPQPLVIDELIASASHENAHDLDAAPLPQATAYVIYTSGSTGRPKGVTIAHDALASYLAWCLAAYVEPDANGAPLVSSLSFDLTVTSLFAPLIAGQRIVLPASSEDGHGHVSSLIRVLQSERDFGWIKLTPSHLRLLAAQMSPVDLADRFRTLIVGGEAIAPHDLSTWLAAMPQVRILNEYGPTEATVGCCVATLRSEDADSAPIAIGRPIAGANLYVLDRQGHLLPPGFAGEIAIGGASLARGYLGRPDLTAERFVPDPWSSTPGARVYLTGDLGRQREDGTFEFLGRTDHQVKIRGHRVELGEIETVLAECPGVRAAVVVVHQDERIEADGLAHADGAAPAPATAAAAGDAGTLAAYVQFDELEIDADASRAALHTHLQSRLPDYMVPALYTFVERWPLTSHGKIDRAALPAPSRGVGRARHVAPRTTEEEVLCAIWSRVLRIDRVGIDDNYFELGGDSIRAIQIAGLAHERGLNCSIELLFRHHTIREIAGALRQTEFHASAPPRSEPFAMLSAADRALLPTDAEDAFPLSALQAGMIFHREYEPESAVYHDIFGYHLRLPLDLDALREAVQGLVDRHPALRTSFHLSGYSEPIQIVHRTARNPLRIADVSHLSADAQHAALQAWMEDEKNKEFDYADPPLLWFQVHIRGTDSFQFSLSFHHAIIDGWSDATMLIELAIGYHALLQGQTPPFTSPATHYRDFVQLERAAIASDEQRRYWLDRLDASTPLTMPRWPQHEDTVSEEYRRDALATAAVQDREHTEDRAHTRSRGINQKFASLPAAVSDGLQRVARDLAVPLKSVLLAAHVRVIGLLAGASDVLTTITAVGRPETLDGDKVIGLHLNSMPFRVRLAGGTWADLIRQTFEQERESLPYRRFPLSELQRLYGRGRLAETSFYYTHYHIVDQLQQIPGFEIVDRMVYEETSFPLVANFGLDPWTQRVTLNVGCDPMQFADVQVQRLSGYYERALDEIASDVHGRVDDAALLGEDERRQLQDTWNDTFEPYDPTRSVQDLFEAQAARTPYAPALVSTDADGRETTLTYAALNERANRLAHVLRARGAQPDTPIGICLDRSAGMAIAVLAVLKAGAPYLPLDPAYPPERLAYMLRDAGARLVITQHARQSLLDASAAPQVLLDDPQDAAAIAACPANAPPSSVRPEHLGYVIYTSGSTGRPKGVALTHLALTNLIQWHLAALPGPRRTLQFASLSFDASFHEMFACWCAGGTLVLIDEITRKDVRLLAATLRAQRVEKAILPGSVLQQLVLEEEARDGFPHIREIIATGERLHVSRAVTDFLAAHPRASLHNHYGPSETHVVTTWTLDAPPGQCPVAPPIGRPIGNCTTFVLDANMQPVPLGTTGELYLGGVCLARGYVGQPAMTGAKFVPNPFARTPGERLYRTGDLAYYTPDGSLEFIGRRDDQVKIRGHRVEPGEVEAAVQEHARVKDVAVMARDDQFGEKRLLCYFVAASQPPPTVAELRKHLATRVPDYMVPAIFIELSAMPLNANGKVNRRALPEVDLHRTVLQRMIIAPRTGIEEVLLELWRKLFDVDRISIRDDFFELGGHSLLATRAVADARRVFGVDLQLRQLFERPTIEGLAAAVETCLASGQIDEELTAIAATAGTDAAADADADADTTTAPLSYAQERLWTVDQLEGGESPAYHMAAAVALDGALDIAVLRHSLAALIARHAPLRTRLAADAAGDPRQHIDPPPAQWLLPVVDLAAAGTSRAPAEARAMSSSSRPDTPYVPDEGSPYAGFNTVLHRLALDESRRPFTLADDWPVRATLVRLGERRHVLLLTLHHVAADGWSLGVLVRELATLYGTNGDVVRAGLPALSLEYADYARAQRAWLQGARIADLTEHWRARLRGAPAQLTLPIDGARGARLPRRGAAVPVAIPREVTDALQALARREGATLFMTVLAGFAALLGRTAGQEDVCIGTPIANRRREEWEGLIGLFVNTLVLRCDLDGRPSFRTLLARTRAMTLDAYAHQDLPFERLVDALQPPRLPGVQPLFQVMLAWQNAPMPALAVPGRELTLAPLTPPAETAKFDLTLSLRDTADGINGTLEYNADLFSRERVTQWAALLTQLLTQAVAAPDRPLGELPLLDPESAQIVLAMGRGPRPDANTTVVSLFERQAARRPHAIALVCGDATLTYAELRARANQVAEALIDMGVGPERAVGLWLERGPDLIVAALGVLKAGAAYVPLDPSLPRERLAQLLGITSPAAITSVSGLAAPVSSADRPLLCLDLDLDPAAAPESIERVISPDQLAYVMHTSGSTGEPKAVAVPHRAIVRLVRNPDYVRLDESERVLHFAPASFDASTFEIWGCLLNGGRLVIVPPGRPSLDDLGDIISREGVTTIWTTSGLFSQMVDTQLQHQKLRGVRQWLAGGDVLSPPHVQRALAALPECRVINGYGPTENTTFTCCFTIPHHRDGDKNTGTHADTIPIGLPIAGTSVNVVDDALQLVPIGCVGELCASGDGLARGYVGQPAFTAERFVPDPFSPEPGGRMYRTGDRVRWRLDGTLEFLGRMDHQVKVRGFRIEPAEIERALLAIDGVQQAVVVAFGETADSRRLVAYVVGTTTTDAAPVFVEQIRDRLAATLPDYMVPRAIVIRDALPLTPQGKIDRRALAEPPAGVPVERPFVPPRAEMEVALARLFSSVLGLDLDTVSADISFFALGGDSIQVLQLVSRARSAGLHLTPQHVFEHQAITALAAVATPLSTHEATRDRDVDDNPIGTIALTPMLAWFAEQDFARADQWNQSAILTTRETIDAAAIREAIAAILRHHDALRSRFVRPGGEGAGEVVQEILPPPLIAADDPSAYFAHVDLRDLPPSAYERLRGTLARDVQASLSVRDGRVLHALWIEGNEQTGCSLVLTVHHAVIDGYSWRVLLEDFTHASQAIRTGAPPRLPTKTASLRQWSRQLHARTATEEIRRDAPFWLSQVTSSAPHIARDFADGANLAGSARTLDIEFSAEETAALIRSGVDQRADRDAGPGADRHADGSLGRGIDRDAVPGADRDSARAHEGGSDPTIARAEHILLAALADAFRRWVGTEHLLIALEHHGRSALQTGSDGAAAGPDVSRTIGWFTSLFPLCLDITGTRTSLDVLLRIASQRRAVPHDGVSFGLLRYLGADADLRHRLAARAPDVSFNYLGQFADGSTSGLFEYAGTPDHPQAPESHRPHLLDFTASVWRERLRMAIAFSTACHRRERIEQLGAIYRDCVRQMLRHAATPLAEPVMAADFPDVDMDPDALTRLLTQLDDSSRS
jgi:amino acid adenylation domain-containing protein/non-ribosomal peptide synthase protein (TIGR01720 family)